MASVKIESGLWKAMWFAKTASTAYSANSLLVLNTSAVVSSGSNAGAVGFPVAGVYSGPAIPSSDSTTGPIRVLVPIANATIRATTQGTLASSQLGSQLDMVNAENVNAAGTTYGAVTLVKYVSATEGIFVISKSVYANVA